MVNDFVTRKERRCFHCPFPYRQECPLWGKKDCGYRFDTHHIKYAPFSRLYSRWGG